MAESPFSFLSDDVVLKIFFHLSDDPRHWARLSCVCQKFSSLISAVCCKSTCLSAVPSAALSAAFPGGWAALHKLAVCCPGLLHSGLLLDNSDFGLHRELESSGDDLRRPPTPIAAVETAVEVVVEEEEKYGGWSLYDDLYFDTVYNHEESEQYERGSVRNDDIAPAPTPMDIVTSIETGAAVVKNNLNPVGNGHLQNPSETRNDHIAPTPTVQTGVAFVNSDVNTVVNLHPQNPLPRNDQIAPTQIPMTSTESSRSDRITPPPTAINPVGNGYLQNPPARNDHNTPPPTPMTSIESGASLVNSNDNRHPVGNGHHPNPPESARNDHITPPQTPMTSVQTGPSVVNSINNPVGNGHLQNPPAGNDHITPPPAAMTSIQTGASMVNSNNYPVGNGHLQNPPAGNDHIAPTPATVTSLQTGASVVNSHNHHHPDRKSPAIIPNEPYNNTTTKKRRLLTSSSSEGAHLAGGGWTLSREQGNKLLASRFRGDSLYLCDWPGCVHPRGKRNYMLFRGFFGNFKKSGVWRAIKDAGRARVEVDCAFCRCTETWDLHAAFCLRRGFGFHDDGEPVVRAYVCENGHVAGACTDLPVYF